jgi:hypothetical protein
VARDSQPQLVGAALPGAPSAVELHLFLDPLRSTPLGEHFFQSIRDLVQIEHVVQRVLHLGIAQRAPAPVRGALSLFQVHVQHPAHEIGVADLLSHADQRSRDLRVEEVAGDLAAALVPEDLQILAAGVEEDPDFRVGNQIPERFEILDPERVDEHRPVARGELHQLQDRPVGALALELHVEGDRVRAPGLGDEFGELFGVGQQFHRASGPVRGREQSSHGFGGRHPGLKLVKGP